MTDFQRKREKETTSCRYCVMDNLPRINFPLVHEKSFFKLLFYKTMN